MYFLDERNIFG